MEQNMQLVKPYALLWRVYIDDIPAQIEVRPIAFLKMITTEYKNF